MKQMFQKMEVSLNLFYTTLAIYALYFLRYLSEIYGRHEFRADLVSVFIFNFKYKNATKISLFHIFYVLYEIQ